jgi:hypothetical protein
MTHEHLLFIPRKAKIAITVIALCVFCASLLVVLLFLRDIDKNGAVSTALTLAQTAVAGLSVIAIIFYTKFTVDISDLKRRNSQFLTAELPKAMEIIEYQEPDFVEIDSGYQAPPVSSQVVLKIRHSRDTHYCNYIIEAYGTAQRVYVQVNVKRMVVSYFLDCASLDDEEMKSRLSYVVSAAETAGYRYEYSRVHDSAEGGVSIQLRLFRDLSDEFLVSPAERLFVANDFASMTRSLIRALPKTTALSQGA